MAIIEVKGLKKNYGELEVLKSIDLEIEEGQVVCIIGPSGSGKSTFLRCLNRLEKTTAGKVIVDGYDLTDKNTEITNYNAQILLINCIGLLSKLYSYADIAIVGGGFYSAGLHNILEASAFGIPVIFGNHYKKNPEADSLILLGGAKSFADEKDTIHFISQLIENKQIINSMGEKSKKFIQQQPNATEFIVNHIIN